MRPGDIIFWYGGWTSRCPKTKPNCVPEPRVDHVGIVTYVGDTLEEMKWVAAEGSPIDVVGEFRFSDVPPDRATEPRLHGFGSVIDD